jgi:hypothetical protein
MLGSSCSSCCTRPCPPAPNEISITFSADSFYLASMLRRRVEISGAFGGVYYEYTPIASAFHGPDYSGTVQLLKISSTVWSYTYANGASIRCDRLTSTRYSFRWFLPRMQYISGGATWIASGFPDDTTTPRFPAPEPTTASFSYKTYEELYGFTRAQAGIRDMTWFAHQTPAGSTFPCLIADTFLLICEDPANVSEPYLTGRVRFWKSNYFFASVSSVEFRSSVYPSIAVDNTPFSMPLSDDPRDCGYVRTNIGLNVVNTPGDSTQEFVVSGSVYRGTGSQPLLTISNVNFLY